MLLQVGKTCRQFKFMILPNLSSLISEFFTLFLRFYKTKSKSIFQIYLKITSGPKAYFEYKSFFVRGFIFLSDFLHRFFDADIRSENS